MKMHSLYDLVERIAHVVPEALNTWRAQTEEGFLSVTENLLAKAVTHLESQAKDLRGPKIHEDTITAAVIGFFNRYGVQASSQTNSRGHVDIYITHAWKPSLVICGEAKIWRSVGYHIDGLAQVLGYCTGRLPYCFLLVYVKDGSIDNQIKKLQAALDIRLPEQQQEACSRHETLQWGLVSGHLHSTGCRIHVLHAGVNLA